MRGSRHGHSLLWLQSRSSDWDVGVSKVTQVLTVVWCWNTSRTRCFLVWETIYCNLSGFYILTRYVTVSNVQAGAVSFFLHVKQAKMHVNHKYSWAIFFRPCDYIVKIKPLEVRVFPRAVCWDVLKSPSIDYNLLDWTNLTNFLASDSKGHL